MPKQDHVIQIDAAFFKDEARFLRVPFEVDNTVTPSRSSPLIDVNT